MVGFQLEDELFVQSLIYRNERILFVQRFVRNDRFALSVTHRRQTLFLDTFLNEVVATSLRTFLRQLLVELFVTFHIRVRAEFDGDIGVVVQQFDQAIHLFLGSLRQLPATELIEDVLHLHRTANGAECKIESIGLAVLQPFGVPLLFGVEVTACGSQHDVFDFFVQFDLIRSISSCVHAAVRSIATHDTQLSVRYRFALFVPNRSFGYELHLRQPELVDLVKSFLIAFVGREETVLRVTGKGDSEIVSYAVERSAHVKNHPYDAVFVRRVACGFEDIETSVTRLTVTGEIECSIFVNIRVHLIGGGVDTGSKGLRVDPFVPF